MTAQTTPAAASFLAALSAEEFILLGASGWESIGFVTGDCVSNGGSQSGSPSRNTQLTRTSEALNTCASAALRRMRDQAAALGATGVVGVEMVRSTIEHGGMETCSATGTAVRRVGSDPKGLQPFTTQLRAAEAWTLLNSGCRLLGLVFGFGVYQAKRQMRAPSSVEEMTELTDSMYAAREGAVRHMQGQAGELRANGVIAAHVDIHTSRHVVVVEVRGTAIKTPAGGPTVAPPQVATAVVDRPSGPLVGRGRLQKHELAQMGNSAAEAHQLDSDG